MKYIKLFESKDYMDEKEIEAIFKSHINWKMIEDIKDMALEYFDNRMVLYIDISVRYNTLCSLKYSHYDNYIKWYSVYHKEYFKDPSPNDDLRYKIVLDNSYKSVNFAVNNGLTRGELISRVKDAYPNENIY